MKNEFTAVYPVSTPVGRVVLKDLAYGLAAVARPFAPERLDRPSERLQHRSDIQTIHMLPDGVWIGSKHMLAIAIGLATRRKGPMTAQEVGKSLYHQLNRPDVARALGDLSAGRRDDDPFWRIVSRHGYYDPTTAIVMPVALARNQ